MDQERVDAARVRLRRGKRPQLLTQRIEIDVPRILLLLDAKNRPTGVPSVAWRVAYAVAGVPDPDKRVPVPLGVQQRPELRRHRQALFRVDHEF